MLAKSLVHLLADGEFHSGEAIGRALGVSRAAVWKRVQSLGDYGLALEAVKGRGYRIPGGLDLISAPEILEAMPARAKKNLARLTIVDEIESTNTHLLAPASVAGDLCIAEFQHGGRGRRGRRWVSPFGSNLSLSLCWVLPDGVAKLEGLSLAVGVVLVEALEALGLDGVRLKWPNDLLVNGAKLGGVLIEVGGDLSGDCKVVIGVGLNVAMPRDSSATAAIDQDWTDLRTCGYKAGRSLLCGAVATCLLDLISTYSRVGFPYYRGRWLQRAAYIDETVVLSSQAGSEQGIFVDVDATGGLVLLQGKTTKRFTGGEVSLRAGHDCRG